MMEKLIRLMYKNFTGTRSNKIRRIVEILDEIRDLNPGISIAETVLIVTQDLDRE